MATLRARISQIESWHITAPQAVLAYLAVVVIRAGLEWLLESRHVLALHLDLRAGLTDLLHVLISWWVLSALLALGLAVFSGRGLIKSNRVVLACLPLIWLPPLLDYPFGVSGEIAYQHDFSQFASSFAGLFNPWASVSYVTPGVRVEVACAVFLSALYAGIMRRGVAAIGWAALAGLWTYGVVFLLGFLPAIWFTALGGDSQYWLDHSVLRVTGAQAALLWYLPLVVVLLPLWLRASHAQLWLAFTASLRPSRLAIYTAICALAFFDASRLGLVGWDWLNPYDLGEAVALLLSLWLAFVAMTLLNDLHDQDIDALTNPDRPLVRGKASPADFALLAGMCAGLALWLAVTVDEVSAYPLGMALALGTLYSAPPLRLRRFLGVSHGVLAGIAFCVYLYGASPVLGNLAFQQVDHVRLSALLLLFFFGAQFKDIKDEAGDRSAGVVTLATLLGAKRAYWLTGLLLLTIVGILWGTGKLSFNATSILAVGLFAGAWVLLRNAERMFWVMLLALAVLFSAL